MKVDFKMYFHAHAVNQYREVISRWVNLGLQAKSKFLILISKLCSYLNACWNDDEQKIHAKEYSSNVADDFEYSTLFEATCWNND